MVATPLLSTRARTVPIFLYFRLVRPVTGCLSLRNERQDHFISLIKFRFIFVSPEILSLFAIVSVINMPKSRE